MHTLGLIGGMSWESTVPYYRLINEAVKARRGGLHSAPLLLYSVDFAEIERMQREDDWDGAGRALAEVARTLEAAGAGALVLCTNTMHRVAPAIEAAVSIPLLHIVDATAEAIRAAGFSRVGLLGTRFTMEQAFYRERMRQKHGIEVIVPPPAARERVHEVIYRELCLGVVADGSREDYRRILAVLAADGAEAVILGCTEIGLLVGADDAAVPLFDSTLLHARKAAAWAMGETACQG